ncbi:hypothetical protein [Streptacidiphilus rugosus]|uniref:hypothetical protein n=1 Tax=Streptacidiphilus rugosus TaxID=405783 RepID=UPI0005698195|nr:hypothetical protein [Streptacidiphilus rugosus]
MVARLSRGRSGRNAAARVRATREQALANAVDWATAYSRHLYGPGHTLTPEDVQLRAWADFNLDIGLEEADGAIREHAAKTA